MEGGYTFPSVIGSEFSSQGSGANSGGYNPVYLEVGYNYSNKGLISFYFSDASARTGNFLWYDTSGASHSYTYVVSIVTFGVSSKYYFGNGTNFRPYIGAMLGYNFINLTSNDELPTQGSVTIAHSTGSFAYQVYAGAVYYLNNGLGLDIHAGYGNSYYAAVGLSFRFQVKQKMYNRKM